MTVLKVKENNWNRKAPDAVTSAEVILEVEREPDADRNTNESKQDESNPPLSTNTAPIRRSFMVPP